MYETQPEHFEFEFEAQEFEAPASNEWEFESVNHEAQHEAYEMNEAYEAYEINEAQTIIHEASHIYYSTIDEGCGQGRAECISQFVADVNGSPLDADYISQCGRQGLTAPSENSFRLLIFNSCAEAQISQ